MKTLNEFDIFYEKEIKQIVVGLEKKRLQLVDRFSFRRYKRNLKILLAICIANGIFISTVPTAPKALVGIFMASCLYALFAPLVIFIRRNLNFEPINQEYKKTVIPRILQFLGPDLKYTPSSGVSQEEFNQGKMFEERIVGYTSEDLVEGAIDGIKFKISDVQARSRSERNPHVKSSNNTTYSLVHGLYAITHLPTPAASRILIKGQHMILETIGGFARNIFGNTLMDSLLNATQAGKLKIGNDIFDKFFTVYTEDAVFMFKILTPAMQQLILALRAEIDLRIIISVFENQAHIAFDGMDLFETNANDSLVEKNISRKYFLCINHTIGLAGAIGKSVAT